jgi:hypothetical protein
MKNISIIAVASAVLLAGCNKSDHTIVAGGPADNDEAAKQIEAKGPVELPPSITASKTYRCGDNSLLYVDWMSDGSARVKTAKTDAGTAIPAGEGSPLTGTSSSASISYNGKSCKA